MPVSRPSLIAAVRLESALMALFWGVLFGCIPVSLHGAQPPAKEILVLHSYHPGMEWTGGVTAGIREVFSTAGQDIRLHEEYLDIRRYFDREELFHALADVLWQKLLFRQFDLVLLSDNDALNFALKHRGDLFYSIPIVFCGINNYRPSMTAGVEKITGVAETPGYVETLELALRLHPGTEQVVVIGNTGNLTGRKNREMLTAAAAQFQGRISFEFWDNLSLEQVTQRLAQLPEGRLVFINDFVTESAGRFISPAESTPALRLATTAPIYSCWEFFLGRGIVGGKLVSAKQQGRLAARLALRVLQGEDPRTIPVVEAGANRFMFDHRELRRFAIQVEALPEESLIINAPEPFYTVSKPGFWMALAAFAGLAAMSIALAANIGLRKKAEQARRQSEARYREFVEGTSDLITQVDRQGRFLFVNHSAERIYGLSPEECLGLKALAFVHPEDREETRRHFHNWVRNRTANVNHENRQMGRHGEVFRMLWTINLHFDEQGEFLLANGIARDITDLKKAEENLRQNQARMEEAQRVAHFGNWEWDIAANRVICSEETFRIFGIEPHPPETAFAAFFNRIHPEDRPSVNTAIQETLLGEKGFDLYFRLQRPDGAVRFVHGLGEVTRDESGKARRLLGITHDLTERWETDELLRESEARFRILMEQAADPIFVHTPDGRLVDVNRAACESLGYSRDELLKMRDHDFAAGVETTWETMTPGEPVTIDGIHVRKDGTAFPVEIRICLVESHGKPYVFALARDVSERKEAEAALKQALAETEEARDKVDAILRSLADGLIVTDMDNRILLMNRTAEGILGFRLKEVFMQSVEQVIKEEELCAHLIGFLISESGEAFNDLEMLDRSRQEVRFFQAHSSAVQSREGLVTGVITILRDVTREREIDRMKSEFISIAAHELRTPLTSVVGYAELLLKEGEFGGFAPQQKAQFVSYIYEKGEVLERIVDDLLNLSRIESGRPIVLDKTPCEMVALLEELVPHHQKETGRHRFEVLCPETPVVVPADRGKMLQVLDNLLSNAVKYSPRGGTIRISGKVQDGRLQICVADEGIGMAPDQVEKVFDKFYRVDTLDTAVGGLGLGMSIARSIVEAHGGRIWVESVLGEGTRVFFTIPLEETAG